MRFSSENTYTKNGLCNFLCDKANHLGNVLTVITDRKIPIDNNTDNVVDYYVADVVSSMDYGAFGNILPGRNFNSTATRYNFNSKESDPELGTLDYGFRIYNPNLGRFLSVDPLTHLFPYWSPYHFAGNSPIENLDLDGLEILNYKTPFRLKTGEAGLNNYVAEYSWSDDKWEGVDMAETAAIIRKGYSSMPMAMNIVPHAKNPGFNQAQTYFKLTPAEQQSADFFGISYTPEMSDAESNTTSGSAGTKKKNERFIRSNTNKTTEGNAGGIAWLIQKIGEGIFGKSPVKASIEAKKDLNNMVNAYRDAIDFVDNSWDFTGAAESWGWTQGQVQQFRVDIINFVADGKMPNNASKEYLSMVENFGVKAINDNKKQGSDAQKTLESK